MRIAYVGAGAAGMYCGSCLHDNTLAASLMRLGHEVALLPAYTPMRTDEEGVAIDRVFYGAVNVYLQQKAAFFRHTPRWLDRLLDRPALLRWVSRFAGSTDARALGELTLSTLAGEDGAQAKELDKLVDWLASEFRPDVVHLSNSLFLGMARRLRQTLRVPVVVSLQGEDLFLGELLEPHRSRAFALLAERARDADLFIAPSRWYATEMAALLGVGAAGMRVVPLGIRLGQHAAEPLPRPAGRPRTIGYLARVCPEKGLHLLVEAFAKLAGEPGRESLRLGVAGYLGPKDRAYFAGLVRRLGECGLAARFEHVGEVDLEGKVGFLRSLDLLAVPTVYREPKGLFALEAMANAVPVVLPRHGSFPEMMEETGGGLLVEPGSVEALAGGLRALLDDEARRLELGRRGRAAVIAGRGEERMARATAAVLTEAVSSWSRRGGGAHDADDADDANDEPTPPTPPITELRTRRKVEFADTDMGGIVHFARFFVYMESAEHELLAAAGTTVHFEHEGEMLGWPRRSASCDYRSPARLGDQLEIHVRVVRKGKSSMTYDFDFACGERLVARGRLASVCCVLGGGRPRPVAIPECLAARLAEHPDAAEDAGDEHR